jgi:Holliday junction resolvase
MRESHIERTVCRAAKHAGWLVFKWSSPNQRGVPDRIFTRAGRVLFVEFKAPGKRPTKLQRHIHEQLRAQGCEVAVIDNIEAGRALIA